MATALITGANSGLGWQLVRSFVDRGYEVIATTRRADPAISWWQLEEAQEKRLQIRPLELTDPSSIASLVRSLEEERRDLSVLVNNAGICAAGALEVVGDDVLRASFETNVFGTAALTRALLPAMRGHPGSRIVFVGAVGALLNTPYLGAYCASKHALDCFAATLDVELQPFGIRALSVHPGAHTTPIGGKLAVSDGKGSPYEFPTERYVSGLRSRIEHSGDSLEDLAAVICDICELSEPRQRYVVSSGMGKTLEPLVAELEALHERERAAARELQRR